MKIIRKKTYLSWRKKNENDAYSLRCFTYAEECCEKMEKVIDSLTKEKISEIEREMDKDGITGFMHGASVSIIMYHWKYRFNIMKL